MGGQLLMHHGLHLASSSTSSGGSSCRLLAAPGHRVNLH
jgi:hypothetical protein